MGSARPAAGGMGPRPDGAWTLAGIPFHADASWLVIVALLTWSLAGGYFPSHYPSLPAALHWAMGLAASLLLFVCVLLHELGHALTARRCGIPVAGIVLFIFGGVAQLAREPRRPAVELAVTLAGPLVSVLLAAACFWLAAAIPIRSHWQLVAAAIARYLAVINTGILLFNLLPGLPLDGGRILRAALWGWTGDLRAATRIASLIGTLLGFGLMGLGILVLLRGAWVGGAWYLILGRFLRQAARLSAVPSTSLRTASRAESRGAGRGH